MTNTERIRAAQLAIDAHRDAVEDFSASKDERAADLLTNLRHWCHAKGVDFGTAVRVSLTHFQAETQPPA